MKKLMVFISLILITATGCKKKEEEVTPKADDNKTAIMIINGKTLYDIDFLNFAGNTIKELDPKDYSNSVIKEQLISNFIEHYLLLMEAEQKKTTINEAEIGAVLESFSSESGSQDLKVYSGSYDTNSKVLAELIRQKLLIETFIYNTINSNIVIDDKKIEQAYNDRYKEQTQRQNAHLLQIFTTDKATAEKAMAELKRGLAFNEVASRYSAGPEKDRGGDLGVVIDSDYPEIFGEAFKLPAGTLSDIIKSDYGYHIFLVKTYKPSQDINFAQEKTNIHFSLYNKEQDKRIKELVDELKKNAQIQYINDINIAAFISKYKSRSNK